MNATPFGGNSSRVIAKRRNWSDVINKLETVCDRGARRSHGDGRQRCLYPHRVRDGKDVRAECTPIATAYWAYGAAFYGIGQYAVAYYWFGRADELMDGC